MSKHPQPPKIEGDQFYKVKETKREYFGNRWFRYNLDDEKVVQVCLIPGDMVARTGKHSSIGVYAMGRLSFMSNYYAMSYVEPVTKEEFNAAFENVVKILQ